MNPESIERFAQRDPGAFVGRIAESPFAEKITLWSSPSEGAQAGGDWCEVIALSDELVAITIGDVCGHGERVAGTMAVMRAATLRAIHDGRVPSEILSVANDFAYHLGDGVLVTAFVGLLDRGRQTLTFANAGHPPPLVLMHDRHAFIERPPADLPLGIYATHTAANYVIALPADALVVIYTDGITEHNHDIIAGELELVEAAKFVYLHPELDAASTVATRVFANGRGDDDAATIVLRAGILGLEPSP